jgi:serine phosphatase RsbU (regulator of sigma subunit)
MGDRWLELNSTLLLYTDGLVEVEGQDLVAKVGQLQAVLGGAGLRAAEDVCATVLEAQLTGSRRDDVAILVVRVTELPSAGEPAAETARAAT